MLRRACGERFWSKVHAPRINGKPKPLPEEVVIIVNTENVQGRDILAVHGLVMGNTIRSKNVGKDIGAGLKAKDGYHIVVVRSTMLPGSVEDAVVSEVEYASGKRMGTEFGVAINPEFLRESTSIHDFYNPPMTVIGESDYACGLEEGGAYALWYRLSFEPVGSGTE